MNIPLKTRRRSKPLRGKRLEAAALRELADPLAWDENNPLTWKSLAGKLGVSRQALATKPAIVEAFSKAKIGLGEYIGLADGRRAIRRTLEQRVDELERQLSEKQRELDRWVEKWVTVEHNCRTYGYDADKIFEPLSKPSRAEV